MKNLQEIRNNYLRFTYWICIFALFNITFSCNNYERSTDSQEYINNPKIGDIYFIDKGDGNYIPLKIKEIGTNNITFFKYKLTTNSSRYIDATSYSMKLDLVKYTNSSKFWTDSILVYTKDNLHSLYEKELIFEIKRDL